MELSELLKTDPSSAISKIKAQTKDVKKIEDYIKEYKDFDRKQRDGQIEKIQVDKALGDGKMSKMVKIYLNHAQNIVETLAAFVIGNPVTLIPSENNDLAKIVKQIWRVNRMDSKLLEATILKFSQTQVALQFYIADSEKTSLLNKVLLFLKMSAQAKEIKAKVLDNTKGIMTPYFDASGDMLAFMWEYKSVEDGKEISNIQIWDQKNYYYLNNKDGGGFILQENPIPHGFDRIPVVYDHQNEPQWYTVRSAVDRHEVALSKLGDANDYSGHPILLTYGEVKTMPLKEESGKHFNIPITIDDEGKEVRGDVKFLEATTAPESNKLELDKLEDAIAYGSGVPNLSLDKLKSLGNVAEKTVKLMFLATNVKASLKQLETQTFIERCLNIIISGVTQTTNKGFSKEGSALYFDVQFNSILPSDIKETVDTLTSAVQSKIISRKTSVGILDLVEDVDAELKLIEEENPVQQITPTSV